MRKTRIDKMKPKNERGREDKKFDDGGSSSMVEEATDDVSAKTENYSSKKK